MTSITLMIALYLGALAWASKYSHRENKRKRAEDRKFIEDMRSKYAWVGR